MGKLLYYKLTAIWQKTKILCPITIRNNLINSLPLQHWGKGEKHFNMGERGKTFQFGGKGETF